MLSTYPGGEPGTRAKKLLFRLDKFDDPVLSIGIALNVSLCRPQIGVTSEHLQISNRCPTVDIFRAAFVMKAPLPEWLEQPTKRSHNTIGRTSSRSLGRKSGAIALS
jgi:hypothetical protein